MKKTVEINSRAARMVSESEILQFIKIILQEFCDFAVPEKPFQVHKQDKPHDYHDELKLYGTKEKGIKYHYFMKIGGRSADASSFSTTAIESFGFSNLWIKFARSTKEGLQLELKTDEQSPSEKIMSLFEDRFGYCRE